MCAAKSASASTDARSAAKLLMALGVPIGTPRAINNLAALRASVDADADLAAHMPTESRRTLSPEQLQQSFRAGSELFDDIYAKQSPKLRGVLAHHHPDLGEYIVHYEYGLSLIHI